MNPRRTKGALNLSLSYIRTIQNPRPMRTLILSVILLAHALQAQTPPDLVWQRCFGGSASESARQFIALPDGDRLLVGSTNSNDGDVTGFNGGSYDIWVVRLDDAGGIIWQRCLGGSDSDVPGAARVLPNGDFIVVGTTRSNNGHVSGNHGANDGWAVRLSGSGSLVWQHCFGGTSGDGFYDATVLPNGDIVAVGTSRSNDGDVALNHGGEDAWAVRFTSLGELVWSRTYGSSAFDVFYSVDQLASGDLIALGYASANNGDVSDNHGVEDFWAASIDLEGNIVWQRCYGGSAYEIGTKVSALADGGAALLGYTESNDGDVVGQHGNGDAWVVRVNSAGQQMWQRPLGGSALDAASGLYALPGDGMLICGRTFSSDGDVDGLPIAGDCWVLQLLADGSIAWQVLLGGSNIDSGTDISPTSDGSLMLLGTTSSNDFDVSGNHGGTDVWLVRLSPFSSASDVSHPLPLLAFPNPAREVIHLQAPSDWYGTLRVSIFTTDGALAYSGLVNSNGGAAAIDVSALIAGCYWLVVQAPRGIAHGKMTIVR